METYLRELIAMPTVSNDQEANNLALDYLQTFFDDRGLHCMRYSFNGYGALVATTKKGDKTPKVMLAAHLDVVPGPAELFALRQDDQNFYGRGTYDMKFAIAAFMDVVETLGDELENHSLGIVITTDEELGGLNGVFPLVTMGYRPEVCILPDGGESWQIETFAKGLIYATIEVHGKASHGSRPWEGDSATFKLLDILSEIRQYFTEQTLDTNTLNIGTITAGQAINQTPAYAKAELDFRYLTPGDREAIMTKVEQACAKYNAVVTEVPLHGHPCVNPIDHPLIQPFCDSITNITGEQVSGVISHGGTDARFLAEVGVPCILVRPHGGGHHADSEWISKQGLLDYPKVILDYLNKVAR